MRRAAVPMQPMEKFEQRVVATVTRFFAQNDRPVPEAELRRLASQLGRLVAERGVPPPVEVEDTGAVDVEGLTALAAEGVQDLLLRDAARQLVKTCFYPELMKCRKSYRETRSDGACRRQELDRVVGRISGSHCVDCPYWLEYRPREHASKLRRKWHGDPADFDRYRTVFLPEDFRALRQCLRDVAFGCL